MKKVRIGIAGVGGIGKKYLEEIQAGLIQNSEVVAVSTRKKETIQWLRENFPQLSIYSDAKRLCQDDKVDALFICTPHLSHMVLAEVSLNSGKHIFVEKPLSVTIAGVADLVQLAAAKNLVFSVQYQERVHPVMQAVKQLLSKKVIGEVQRIHWQVVQYYRDEAYYSSTDWRGTWAYDGGGVLLNQAIHQLDLWQYLFGMPEKIFANCRFGAYRKIEVVDEAVAVMSYSNDMQGTFIASVNEKFSQDRLEIIGETGTILLEDAKTLSLFNEEGWKSCPVSLKTDQWEQNRAVVANDFIAHVLGKIEAPLLSTGTDAMKSIELVNAMWLSTWLEKWVTLPLEQERFQKVYAEKTKI